MATDEYSERLDEMIELFQEYKSGSVTLDNITKLCQTLGLESFIDDIDTETARLSTASKIIVIDIDFSKARKRVVDVKLVLASNFDNFNYFIDHQSSDSISNNILLNSLTQYPDLHEFHSNLKFLHLLDNFSNIEIDPANTSVNTNFGPGNGSSTSANESSSYSTNFTGKLDLFKYYTELALFIRQYFAKSAARFTVSTNLNNSFGIYISNKEQTLLAKIYFEKSKDPQHRLYEFVHTEGNGGWINESPESYASGISLVMEILPEDEFIDWFPQDFIPADMIVQKNKLADENELKHSETANLSELLSKSKSNSKIADNIHLMNDFTTKLIKVRKFDISNDNIDVLMEILNWLEWSELILKQLYHLILEKDGILDNHDPNILDSSLGSISTLRRRSSVGQKRRRHSNKNRRPSITEAAMLKDEGLQQFNLHEIMTDPGTNLTTISNKTSHSDQNVLKNEKMTIEVDEVAIEDPLCPLQLLISEDHVSLAGIAKCSLYDRHETWNSFIDILKSRISK